MCLYQYKPRIQGKYTQFVFLVYFSSSLASARCHDKNEKNNILLCKAVRGWRTLRQFLCNYHSQKPLIRTNAVRLDGNYSFSAFIMCFFLLSSDSFRFCIFFKQRAVISPSSDLTHLNLELYSYHLSSNSNYMAFAEANRWQKMKNFFFTTTTTTTKSV